MSDRPDQAAGKSIETRVAVFGFAILVLGAILWAYRSPLTEKTDFSVTYIGAYMVHHGRGAELYDVAEQDKLKAHLIPNAEPIIYEHPPFEALLLSPLGGLPYRTAYLIWGLLNGALWLLLPWILRPYAKAPREDLGYLALWLIFAPLGIALYQGQSSLVLLALFMATFVAFKQGRDFRAGLWLGLGLFKFQFVLPFALILFLLRKWKFMQGFSLMAALLAILSVAAVGVQGVVGYFTLLSKIVRHPANSKLGSATDMATLNGFVHAVLGDSFGAIANVAIVGVLSLSLVLFIVWRWVRSGDRGEYFDLMFAASIAGSLVMGFHMFTHDLSPLLLAMLLVMAQIPRDRPLALRVALWATLILLWTPPIYIALVASHRMFLLFPVLIVFFAATMQLASQSIPVMHAGRLETHVAD